MTLTAEPVRAPEAAPPDRPPAAATATAPAAGGVHPTAIAVAVAISTLAVLVVGFVGYLIGFSGLSEARSQHALRQSLQRSLAAATAPTGPVAEGKPVAVLDIPAIGLQDAIVVEGASSRDLMAGPGHLPATPLPGQAGTSTIYGKRATFGAPFARLLQLKVGDPITVTTGQGRSRYVVSSFGDSQHPAPANSANRLLLVTATDSFDPSSVVVVSADLTSKIVPSSGRLSALSPQDEPLARDDADSLVPLAGWSQLLLLTGIVGAFLVTRRDVRWPAVLCLTPVALALLWCVYENAAGLLPNVQ